MIYTVRFTRLADNRVMQTLQFGDLAEARSEAEFAVIGGQGPVEVTIVDDAGQEHFLQVFDDI